MKIGTKSKFALILLALISFDFAICELVTFQGERDTRYLTKLPEKFHDRDRRSGVTDCYPNNISLIYKYKYCTVIVSRYSEKYGTAARIVFFEPRMVLSTSRIFYSDEEYYREYILADHRCQWGNASRSWTCKTPE